MKTSQKLHWPKTKKQEKFSIPHSNLGLGAQPKSHVSLDYDWKRKVIRMFYGQGAYQWGHKHEQYNFATTFALTLTCSYHTDLRITLLGRQRFQMRQTQCWSIASSIQFKCNKAALRRSILDSFGGPHVTEKTISITQDHTAFTFYSRYSNQQDHQDVGTNAKRYYQSTQPSPLQR